MAEPGEYYDEDFFRCWTCEKKRRTGEEFCNMMVCSECLNDGDMLYHLAKLVAGEWWDARKDAKEFKRQLEISNAAKEDQAF